LAAFAYGRTAGFHPSSRLNLTSTIQSGHVRQNDIEKPALPRQQGDGVSRFEPYPPTVARLAT